MLSTEMYFVKFEWADLRLRHTVRNAARKEVREATSVTVTCVEKDMRSAIKVTAAAKSLT